MNTLKSIILSIIILFCSSIVYSQNNRTLLIFSADWCEYCQVAKKDIKTNDKLSRAIENYNLINLNYDIDKKFVTDFKVKTIPTFIILEDGKEVKRMVGYKNSRELLRFLK